MNRKNLGVHRPWGSFRPYEVADHAYYPVRTGFAMIRQDDFETIIVTTTFVARIYEPNEDDSSLVTISYLDGRPEVTVDFGEWNGE